MKDLTTNFLNFLNGNVKVAVELITDTAFELESSNVMS